MKTLGIAVLNNSDGTKEVDAQEVNASCTPLTGSTGNIEVDPEAQILWMNCGDDWHGGGSHTFLVTFERKTIPGKWPFKVPKKPNDQTLIAAPSPAGPVDTTLKNATFRQEWKYSVEVKNSSIEHEDPMIIIRGKSLSAAVVLVVGATLLVVAAVLLFRRFLPGR